MPAKVDGRLVPIPGDQALIGGEIVTLEETDPFKIGDQLDGWIHQDNVWRPPADHDAHVQALADDAAARQAAIDAAAAERDAGA